jgi:uncharacterized protein DUF5658
MTIAELETTSIRRVRGAARRIVMGRFAYSFVVFGLLVGVAPTATAQESGSVAASTSSTLSSGAVAAGATAAQPALLLTHVQQKRPAAMVPLYGGFAAMQALDYVTTTRALSSGAGSEANPLMAPVAGNPAAFLALKAGSVVGVVWAGEKLWKKNRVGAVVFMVAMDSAMATIAAHNYSIARR